MPVNHRIVLAALLAALLVTAGVPLSAQWPKHPVLSGVWENVGWRELQQQSGDISGTGGSA
jgi:hypothetical protein